VDGRPGGHGWRRDRVALQRVPRVADDVTAGPVTRLAVLGQRPRGHREQGGGGTAFQASSIAVLDSRTGARVGTVAPGVHICVFATSGSDLWACDADQSILLRVDARKRQVVDQLPLPVYHGSFTPGFGSIWVGDVASPTVRKVSPRFRTSSPPCGAARRCEEVHTTACTTPWSRGSRGGRLVIVPATRRPEPSMQPTLFTATYSFDRASETPRAPRPEIHVRLPRKALAATLAAVAIGGSLVAAAEAPGSAAPGTRHLGAGKALVTAGAIAAPGQFGWQARCPHNGPAKR
jgi:hypothetical protein